MLNFSFVPAVFRVYTGTIVLRRVYSFILLVTGFSVSELGEDAWAPPELLTLDVGVEPILEVGPALVVPDVVLVLDVEVVPDGLVAEVAFGADGLVVPDTGLVPDGLVAPEVEVCPTKTWTSCCQTMRCCPTTRSSRCRRWPVPQAPRRCHQGRQGRM